jgi:general secretion pathway protein L
MSYKLFLTPSGTQTLAVFMQSAESAESAGAAPVSEASSGVDEKIASTMHWDWALYDAMGNRCASGVDTLLHNILQLIAQNDIEEVSTIGLLPASLAFRCNINIPSRQARVVQQALPFAVEELVAQDIDSLHIATGERDKKNDIPVLAIERQIFSSLFSFWRADALTLEAVYVDAQLLPMDAVDLVVFLSGDRCWLKAAGSALQMKITGLAHYIETWLEEYKPEGTAKLKIYQAANVSSDVPLIIAGIQQIQSLEVSVESTSLAPCEFFAESFFHVNDAIDLCQGEFAVNRGTSSNWRKWLGVAAVLAVWFVAEVALNLGKGLYYEHKADQSLQMALQEYRAVFPDDRRANESNLRKFLESKLRMVGDNSKSSDFLAILGEAGAQYYKINNRDTVTFNSINFNAQRGELIIELQAKTLDQLDQFKTGISRAGLESRISSAVKEKDYIRGRISVTGS